MADYEQDDDGVIHLAMDYGQADFTFCGRDFTGSDSARTQTFSGKTHPGPANCAECGEAFARLRDGMKGTRWAPALVQGMPEDRGDHG